MYTERNRGRLGAFRFQTGCEEGGIVMGMDYTVIIASRKRFGDNKIEDSDIETEAPFFGLAEEFPFTCPNVNRAQRAVLQFESQGVGNRNVVTINGTDIAGGITPGPVEVDGPQTSTGPMALWKSHCLIVPADLLNDQNVLRIESTKKPLGVTFDDFVIDNAVVFFKTRDQVVTPT